MSDNPSLPLTLVEEMYSCCNTTAGAISITIFSIINITIILPLCMIVLYLGFQQWRQQSPNTPMSHCDVLTHNTVLINLLQVTGSVLSCYSIHADVSGVLFAGLWMLWFYLSGQMMFFSLTCVDYYLAVVFPIFYLRLRKRNFIRARNITIGCIWLGNIVWINLVRFMNSMQITIFLSVMTTSLLLVIVFTCFSVLYGLIRPGPGEGGRRQVDQSKLKAFNTIAAILAVLTCRFLGATVCNSVFSFHEVKEAERCAAWLTLVCTDLPGSLLQPILFLQRTGKLPFCKNNK